MSELIDSNLKEEIIKLTISGETEKLKEILQNDPSLYTIKDWVILLSSSFFLYSSFFFFFLLLLLLLLDW